MSSATNVNHLGEIRQYPIRGINMQHCYHGWVTMKRFVTVTCGMVHQNYMVWDFSCPVRKHFTAYGSNSEKLKRDRLGGPMSHEPCKLRTIALRRDSGRFLEEPQKAYDYFRSALRERQVTIPELFWAQDEQMYHGSCGHWGQVFIDACTCTRMMLLTVSCAFACSHHALLLKNMDFWIC